MKRVYVLGAGFSRAAGVPLQSELLERIRAFNPEALSLMEVPPGAVSRFQSAQATVVEFLTDMFPHVETPALEDVFTLLDHTIASRDTCAGWTWGDLVQVRDHLSRCMLFILHHSWAMVSEEARQFYQGIAAKFLEERFAAGHSGDPFSVISLNWDYVLEDSFYWCIRQAGLERRADVDFCCYTTPLAADSLHTPSLKQRASGLYNLKLIKLHGSANFLRCPGCNRLFTGVGSIAQVWDQYVLPTVCRYCRPAPAPSFGRSGMSAPDSAPELEPFLITPTYLKAFESAHIRTIWHNAHIELSEANEVVFIGYSLPEADYHVRALLRRAVPATAQVTVVLAPNDNPWAATDDRLVPLLPATRYRSFFGERATFRFAGAADYFGVEVQVAPTNGRLDRLRQVGQTLSLRDPRPADIRNVASGSPAGDG